MNVVVARGFERAGNLARYFGDCLVGCGWCLREEGWKSVGYYVRASAYNLYLRLRNRRSKRVECPVCGWRGHDFLALAGGSFILRGCYCPNCDAQERHRGLHLYLKRHVPQVFTMGGSVLHVAPEPQVSFVIRSNPRLRYFGTDLEPEKLQRTKCIRFRTDITRLATPDDTFDLLFCLHVLEHIGDDARAIAELQRVMKPGAMAFFMVPMTPGAQETEEFGKPEPLVYNHYRSYGRDFAGKLKGFDVAENLPQSFLDPDEIRRHGVRSVDIIYQAIKTE